MRHSFLIIAVLALMVCQHSAGQVNLTLNIRTPMPSQISVWERDRTIIQAIITNPTGTTYLNVRPSFVIRNLDNNRIVASSNDNHAGIPRFTIPPTTTVVKNGPDLVNTDAVRIDPGIRTIVTTTNSLPEGSYEICLKLLAESGTELTATPVCRTFMIVIPDPPTLISPVNGDSIPTNFRPTFTWTPVVPAPGVSVRYKIVVAPIYQGQTPKNAIEQNQPLFSQFSSTPSLFYGPALPQMSLFPQATGFAWQVTAMNAQGQPITRNEGKSPVFRFSGKKTNFVIQIPPILPKGPVLMFPEPNASISSIYWGQKNELLEFEWKYPPYQAVKLRLRVVKINPGQTASDAIAHNTSYHFEDVNSGHGVYLQWQIQEGITRLSFPPLEGGNDYAWQVLLINEANGATTAASEIRRFTLTGSTPFSWETSTVSGTLRYKFTGRGGPGRGLEPTWPLANATVKVVVQYKQVYLNQVLPKVFRWEFKLDKYGQPVTQATPPGDYGKTIGITTTDGSGNFSLSFIHNDSTGVIRKTTTTSYPPISTSWRRILRIELDAPERDYYTSPADDIIIQPGQTKPLGNLTARVRDYKLTASFKADPSTSQQALPKGSLISGMETYLLRKVRPLGVPSNEGEPPPRNPDEPGQTMQIWFHTMEVVGKGETDASAKQFVFTRCVQKHGPNDTYYLFGMSSSNSSLSYTTIGPVAFKYEDWQDKAVSSDEYTYPATSTVLTAYPLKPSISGTVRTTETLLPLSNATVLLMSSQGWLGIEKSTVTDSTGRFVFSDLPTTINASGGVTGPFRSLFVARKGYAARSFPVGILAPGKKSPEKAYNLEPLSTVTGKITDLSGNGVSSNVRVIGGESKDFDPPLIFVNFKRAPVSFEVMAPKGENTIIVDPTAFAPLLLPETVKVNITGKTIDVGVVKLKAKQYRLVVEVRKKGLTIPGAPKSIAGAEVILKDESGNPIVNPGGQPIKGTTNPSGRVEFSFQNSSSTIFGEVTGPLNGNYVPATGSLQPTFSSKAETLIVLLSKGASISGHVYVGPQNTPVAGAEVALKSTSAQNLHVATTDSSGFYVLHNVPIGPRAYIASKQQSNLVGNEKTLNVPAAGLQNIDFVLTPYTAMDISKLLGFPIAVEALTQSGNQTKISGKFVGLKDFGNGQFSTLGTLSFSGVEIVAGSGTSVVFGQTVPVAKPKSDSVITEQNSLPIKVFGKYNATLNDTQTGIAVVPDNEGMGVVKGFVHATAGSFQATYFKVQGDEFLLSVPGAMGHRTSTITASKNEPLQIPNGFAASSKSGHSLVFKLYGFDAVADSSLSMLTADSLRLYTTMHTNLQNVQPKDLNLTVGLVSFAPGTTALGAIVPEQTVTMKMDNWTLELTSMMLYGQLSATEGTLKTPTVSVPLKKLTISPTAFISNEFDLGNLSLAGIVPLIVKKDPILNYDPTITQWILGSADASGLSAVIAGLPGMASGDSIALDGFILKSKDNNPNLSPAPSQQPIMLYGLGKLTPSSIQVFQQQGYVELFPLSFAIPKAGNISTVIHYLKENGSVKLKVVPTPILFPGNGLEVALAETAEMPYLFDNKGLRVKGRVFEAGKYSIPVWLLHTKDSTSIWVESPNLTLVSPTTGWFSFPIGASKTSLEKLIGGMKPVNANEWSNFWFAGDLAGTPGISDNKKRLTFTVVGTVKANNQELGVDNIPTPFGNMEWVFDFEHKRLHGSIPSINKELNGSGRITGTAAAVIDGSGWFLVSGGTLELDSPHFKLAAALVLGDYPNISFAKEFKDVFLVNPKKYSHDGQIPAAFTKALSGFYFSGLAELPPPVLPPSIDIHLDPLVHVSVDYYYGGEVALGMNFSGGNVYYVASRIFAGASVDVGASGLIACLSGHIGGEVYIYGKGEYNSGNGDWWVEGGAGLILSGGGTVGYGCCDSDCECFLPLGECITSSWSDTIDIGILKCRLGQGGPKFCAVGLCL